MDISKKINVLNTGTITVKYSDFNCNTADNPVAIYNENKLSLHLSDGLFGVLSNKTVGGEKGDVLLFSPDEIHFGRFTVDGRHRLINVFLSEEFFDNLVKEYSFVKHLFLNTADERINCIRASLENKIKIIDIGEKIATYLSSKEPDTDLKIFSSVLELIILCADLYSRQKNEHLTSFEPPVVRKIMDIITLRYAEKLTVGMIASEIGCSSVYISKQFKKYTAKSIYQYLTEYRITKSEIFLKSGYSVADACYASGFGDCSNFIRTFKKIKGISPLKYKKT